MSFDPDGSATFGAALALAGSFAEAVLGPPGFALARLGFDLGVLGFGSSANLTRPVDGMM